MTADQDMGPRDGAGGGSRPAPGETRPAVRLQPEVPVAVAGSVAGEGLAAGLVVSEAARRLQQALDALAEGQADLRHELARSRRRMAWALGLLLVTVGAGAVLWLQQGKEPPVMLPGDSRDLGREDLVAQIEDLTDQVHNARQERNVHLSESLRLRSDLLASERRLDELTHGLGELAARKVEPPIPTISLSVAADRDLSGQLVHAVDKALVASGIADLSFVEIGSRQDGELLDVLLARRDAQGAAISADRFERARLTARSGLVELVLERAAPVEGAHPLVERVAMPGADIEAWEAVGLVLDKSLITVAQAARALTELLEGQIYELESLGGYDADGRLLELVLVERNAQQVVWRRWSAARATLLPVGPTLLLQDGHFEEDGSARPFWQGRARLVLQGARYATFLNALSSSSRPRNESRRG